MTGLFLFLLSILALGQNILTKYKTKQFQITTTLNIKLRPNKKPLKDNTNLKTNKIKKVNKTADLLIINNSLAPLLKTTKKERKNTF